MQDEEVKPRKKEKTTHEKILEGLERLYAQEEARRKNRKKPAKGK